VYIDVKDVEKRSHLLRDMLFLHRTITNTPITKERFDGGWRYRTTPRFVPIRRLLWEFLSNSREHAGNRLITNLYPAMSFSPPVGRE
jgi:hypothetical protein